MSGRSKQTERVSALLVVSASAVCAELNAFSSLSSVEILPSQATSSMKREPSPGTRRKRCKTRYWITSNKPHPPQRLSRNQLSVLAYTKAELASVPQHRIPPPPLLTPLPSSARLQTPPRPTRNRLQRRSNARPARDTRLKILESVLLIDRVRALRWCGVAARGIGERGYGGSNGVSGGAAGDGCEEGAELGGREDVVVGLA